MTNAAPETFFDNVGGGGAPSASLKNVDDYVHGEILDQFMVEAKKFGTDEVERDRKTGEPIQQLVVILQTDLRGWQGVARIPTVDANDRNSAPKGPEEDDGKRAVYVKPFTNIHAAIGKAVQEATGQRGGLRNGGKLGVKITRLEDTGKGNPLKHHAAVYTPPAASSQFFDESKTQGGPGDASTQQAQQAPPAQQQSAPPAQQDPWASQGQQASAPPF